MDFQLPSLDALYNDIVQDKPQARRQIGNVELDVPAFPLCAGVELRFPLQIGNLHLSPGSVLQLIKMQRQILGVVVVGPVFICPYGQQGVFPYIEG